MPFLVMRRTDIPNGVLQVLDLFPNTSLRNSIYDSPGQTKYVNRLASDTLGPLVANRTTAEYTGLAAYLIDHVENNVTNVSITVAVANASANAIVVLVNAGSAVTLAAVNTALTANGVANAGAGTQLNANGSDGVLVDVLKILAGGQYILPSGSLVGNVAGGPGLGAFIPGTYRDTYDTGALAISFGDGSLAVYTSAVFDYLGTTGAALTVYANDGTLFV
jgi:hypothetical protein